MFYLILTFLLIQAPDYPKKLQELNGNYQVCLDEGKLMVNCSRDFYSQMTELMGCILEDLKENSPKQMSHSIFQTQQKWEIDTQTKFDLINQRLDSITKANGIAPLDEVMFAYNDKALIIEERIVELIEQLK